MRLGMVVVEGEDLVYFWQIYRIEQAFRVMPQKVQDAYAQIPWARLKALDSILSGKIQVCQ